MVRRSALEELRVIARVAAAEEAAEDLQEEGVMVGMVELAEVMAGGLRQASRALQPPPVLSLATPPVP